MLDSIVVPLDGSLESDRILTQLRRLLVRNDADVTLVEVIPAERLKNERVPGQLLEEAHQHLARVAEPLRTGGARVETKVLAGDAAERILLYTLEKSPALVVMATHGRSGIQRWTRGSVAERVLRECRAPVLLANPSGLDAPRDLRFKRILVPLDGSSEAAEILPLVRALADLYDSEVVLHFTIPTPPPSDSFLATPLGDADAKAVLEPYARTFEGRSVELSTCVSDPALGIVEAAERRACDLIAMSTHGRSGISRWVFGSVAEHVLREARCPLLVRRVSGVKKALPTE